ncbi:Bug family tripartite tricarboxylate transporter substrate binding protein [Mesorhizobium sp. ANAO-SY3R2]|uniref:Bug family tripartite tricarboxylate transporter substrate binding protein n=1 Tax=Mesorhizobium sp. ANAO-SY3R2 TaxID=3166644 RepID=UPI0036711E67
MKFTQFVAGMAFALVAGTAQAEDYPSKPITLLVGAAAGGPTDILARIVADGLKTRLPQPVVVENRPGQGGQLANVLISNAAADGYTLAVTSGGIAALPFTGQDFKLDPVEDFTDVALMASATRILLASADAPFSDAKGLIEYAKANPGKVNYGDMGGTNTLDIGLLASKAGIEISSIPYAGSASQVQTAIAAGEVDIALDTYSSARNFLEQGKTKALAVGTAARYETLPDVPSIGEFVPGSESSSAWYAIIGPKGIPAEIVGKLNAEINGVLEEEGNRKKIAALGLDLKTGKPADLEALMKKDSALWAEAVKATGYKAPQ